MTKGLCGFAFKELKSTFNTQKVHLKKKSTHFIKRIDSIFKGKKMTKTVLTKA